MASPGQSGQLTAELDVSPGLCELMLLTIPACPTVHTVAPNVSQSFNKKTRAKCHPRGDVHSRLWLFSEQLEGVRDMALKGARGASGRPHLGLASWAPGKQPWTPAWGIEGPRSRWPWLAHSQVDFGVAQENFCQRPGLLPPLRSPALLLAFTGELLQAPGPGGLPALRLLPPWLS